MEQGFMPWLMHRVEVQLTKSSLGRRMLDQIIREVVQKRCEAYAKVEEAAKSAAASARATPLPEGAMDAPVTEVD